MNANMDKNPLAPDKDAAPNVRKEIVAVTFSSSGDGIIMSTDPAYIAEVADAGGVAMNYITRGAMQFMAVREPDKNLRAKMLKIAAGPALFIVEADGTMSGPSSFAQKSY